MPTETFTNDGQEVTWTVPDGVTELTIKTWGAAGWNGDAFIQNQPSQTRSDTAYGVAGRGGQAQATFSVSPGDTVTMRIGSRANGRDGGWPDGKSGRDVEVGFGPYANAVSGGGGGSTRVDVEGITLVQAGGGGGGGAASCYHDYIRFEDDGGKNEPDGAAGDGGYANNQNGLDATATASEGGFNPETDTVSANGGVNGFDSFAGQDGSEPVNALGAAAGGGAGGGYSPGGGGEAIASEVGGLAPAAAGGGGSGTEFIASSGTNINTQNDALSPDNGAAGEVILEYPEPPDPISALSVTGGDDQTVLMWTNDPDDYGEIEVYRATASGGETTADYTLVDTISGTTESYTDTTAITDGERYYYRVVGIIGGNSVGFSNEGSAVTDLPAPTGLSASNVGDESVDLSWTATHDNGDTRVEYRADGGSAWTTAQTVAASTEQATVTGLLNGQQYDARVVAQTEHAETEDQ